MISRTYSISFCVLVIQLAFLCSATNPSWNRHPRPILKRPSTVVKDIPAAPSSSSLCDRTRPTTSELIGGDACVTCQNSESCCDGSSCCSGGKFCCELNNTCCQDTCCKTSNEQCCSDPTNGGVCCESEWSFCCVPQPEYDLPSRCCPRWFVCCDLGEYGCCNPDTGLPLTEAEVHDQRPRHSEHAARLKSGAPSNVYALILEPTWIGNMDFDVMSINVTTGAMVNVSKVRSFKTGGEEQRQFMFDKVRRVFYLLQTDNDADGHNPMEAPIRLFTVNPDSGTASACEVSGAYNLVTGYRLIPGSTTIVFATYWLTAGPGPSPSNSNSAASESSSGSPLPDKYGYKFYHLDVTTCVAELVAQSVNPRSAQDNDNYAGWFHDVSPDGSVVYRLGYQDVVTSSNFGIGATVLVPSSSSASSGAPTVVHNTTPIWQTIPRPDGTHEDYITLNLFAPSVPSASLAISPFDVWFVSMAPTNNITEQGDLSLYMWSPNDPVHNVSLLATFSNAHQYPAMSFGPLSESLSLDCTRYAALVVKDSDLGSTYDTLAIVFVDGIKPPGRGRPSVVLEAQLQPGLLAETVSSAGIGLPES